MPVKRFYGLLKIIYGPPGTRRSRGGSTRAPLKRAALERSLAALARADADYIVQGRDEDFAVAELARARGLRDGGDDRLLNLVGDDDLDLDLGHELDLVLRAAIGLCVAALPPVALHLADGHPDNVQLLQGVLHRLQKVRPDDGFNFLHPVSSGCLCVARGAETCVESFSASTSAAAFIRCSSSFRPSASVT